MAKYKCKVCGHIFEGDFDALPDDWVCPVCKVSKEFFEPVKENLREETVFLDIDESNPSIQRDPAKCVKCGNCKSVCSFKQGVYGHYDIQTCKCKTVCVDCGQCSIACPTGAIHLKEDYPELEKLIQKGGKTFVFQTSPSVRVSLGEEFGMEEGSICTGKLVSALRVLGADYVFDTTFGADLTIMEEARELTEKIKSGSSAPIMTSCCPAWVKFVEIFYPEKIKYLSSCKSPISMQGAMIKSYWAQKMGIDKNDIISVAVTPCSAKKAEIKRTGDADFVIPVRELALWMKRKGIKFQDLPEGEYDSMMGTGSGGGIIFGSSGGVMEAALRTAYFMLTGENPQKLEFKQVRSLDGFVKATVKIGQTTLRLAIVSGLVNARKVLDKLEGYDFVEVMACLGGCMAGGGQPKNIFHTYEQVRKMRSKSLYDLDKASKTRFCHENPDIVRIYDEYLKTFGSPLLHTSYMDRSDILG